MNACIINCNLSRSVTICADEFVCYRSNNLIDMGFGICRLLLTSMSCQN